MYRLKSFIIFASEERVRLAINYRTIIGSNLRNSNIRYVAFFFLALLVILLSITYYPEWLLANAALPFVSPSLKYLVISLKKDIHQKKMSCQPFIQALCNNFLLVYY